MRLLHYTEEPLAYDSARTYEQSKPRSFGKPVGFWVSVQGEDDWPSWCIDNEFATYTLKHVSEVTLAPDANVLMLDTVDAIVDFHDSLSVEDTSGWLPHTRLGKEYVWKSRPIDWTPITDLYDGIIIAPYQWSCRMKYDWYYGWDVASGCIWNLRAIGSVHPVENLAQDAVVLDPLNTVVG